jgi:DNA ligase-4
MLVFFDILLLDDDVCLRSPHRQRRLLLKEVVQKAPGRAEIAEQEILDFDRTDSQPRLETSFAKAIAQRWEGYVLKASDEPYFPIYAAGVNNSFGRWIKLKKDYIPGLGDTVDLLLVGACYDAQDAAALSSLTSLRWTHFLVGCLLNKDAAIQCEARAHYRIVDAVNRYCMHWKLLQLLNQLGEFYATNPEGFEGFDVQYGRAGLPAASVIFKKPFVVEMMGSGFEKPSGARYFTLRFPRILKVHTERTYEDAASFRELQLLAEDARSVPVDELSQEEEQWRKRLKVGSGLKDYIVRRSRSLSTESSSSTRSDVPGGSDTIMGDHEDGLQSMPVQSSTEKIPSFHANIDRTHGSIQGTPAVYVDESRLSLGPSELARDKHVLAENQNSSNRQASKHGGPRIIDQSNVDMSKYALRSSQATTAPTTSSSPPVTNHNPMHREGARTRTNEPAISTQMKKLRNPESPHQKRQAPISPLTTIPVYMSGTPSEGDMESSEQQNSSSLSQFLQALGSDETQSSFKRSNPRAAHQGAVFGIALVNPCELPLGQVIHEVAKGLSRSLNNQNSHPPANAMIFFLDAVILKENINPEDPEFCLRRTWRALGVKYYYACLRWSSAKGRNHEGAEPRIRPEEDHGNSQGISNGPSPSLFVSFDEDEILALGEYTSLDGLTDPTAL